MKALSLKQPFAELVVSGRKTIELRKWNTKFRGKFLIHSSKTPDKKGMEKFGFGELPNGFIVGEANLANVKEYKSKEEFDNDKSWHLANDAYGKYGFILEDAKRIKPIPAKGMLGFWDYNSIKKVK